MTNRRAQLGFLGAVGAVWLAMFALSLRFQGPEFRPWERAADLERGAFVPNLALRMDELGDLEAWTWVRALQTPKPVTFSTDRWGYRNPDGITAPRVVVVGDSYAAGSGLSDEQTLTARMTALLGEPVYNFAYSSPQMPGLFLADPRFRDHPPQVVVFTPSQRNLVWYMLAPYSPPIPTSTLEHLSSRIKEAESRYETSNGLTRWARYLYNGLRHEAAGTENLTRLPDGTPALLLPLAYQHLHLSPPARHAEAVTRAIVAFQQQLAQRGTRLLFAPVPDMGNVYPELYPEEQRGFIVEPSFLAVVLESARAAGVEVVNLQQWFRAQKWPYLYQLDDSHWNERGVALSARALANAVRALVLRAD